MSRKWIHFPAEDDLVDALHSAASAKKQSASDYIRDVLIEKMRQAIRDEEEEATDLVKIFVMDREEDDRKRAYNALIRIAKSLIERPDEEKEKKVRELCQTQGVTFEEMMSEAEETPMYDSNGTTQTDEAVQFMAKNFPSDTPIHSLELSEKMHKAGYGDRTIAEARRIVGATHCRMTGGKHGWMIPSFKQQ